MRSDDDGKEEGKGERGRETRKGMVWDEAGVRNERDAGERRSGAIR